MPEHTWYRFYKLYCGFELRQRLDIPGRQYFQQKFCWRNKFHIWARGGNKPLDMIQSFIGSEVHWKFGNRVEVYDPDEEYKKFVRIVRVCQGAYIYIFSKFWQNHVKKHPKSSQVAFADKDQITKLYVNVQVFGLDVIWSNSSFWIIITQKSSMHHFFFVKHEVLFIFSSWYAPKF